MTILWMVLIIIGVILIALLLIRPDYNVSRSRIIRTTPEQVFDKLKDFKSWPEWSPWLLHEPDCPITYSESPAVDAEGGWYHWDGKRVGEGKMTHVSFQTPQQIKQRIEFMRPMRSESDIVWTIEPAEPGHSKVTWAMQGRMTFFMRPMARMMDMFIGKDYELGLALLATELGDDEQPIKLRFIEQIEQPALDYLYIPFSGSIADLGQVMQRNLGLLEQFISQHQLGTAGEPMGVYHKVNPRKNTTDCQVAIPVDISALDKNQFSAEVLAKNADGIALGSLPGYTAQQLILTGSYEHLPYVWACAFNHLRMTKAKRRKPFPMIERYLTKPAKGDSLIRLNEQQTALEIALR